ncbi:hypothetical protein AVEN_99584-1 [Araneus ventricosus]|uniref:Tc1-like transposase DDE domain-containing protein n=1 Tax=Araneus ventricosus TaxID=182803 RepID=A0A4Y2VF79_ARAVE|nr:hypothetical protein AVEN_99584-1 [Araneus ventricosus]
MSVSKIYGPFFFMEKKVTGSTYLDILEIWLFPHIKEDLSNFVFQQDGALPHWATEVRCFLNTELPSSWIGHSGPDDLMLHSWPPTSLDMTPCDFFLWGFGKDKVYVPPLLTNLCELKQRISAAQSLTSDTLQHVWQEFTYRLDIIRVTKGSYIENL